MDSSSKKHSLRPRDRLHHVVSMKSCLILALPIEVLSIVGEFIQDLRTLKNLIQVCSAFEAIFTPFLNADREILLHKLSPLEWDSMPIPSTISQTKSFEVRIYEFSEANNHYDPDMNDEYAAFLASWLSKMPNLQYFRWFDDAFELSYELTEILRNPIVLDALKSSMTLKDINIAFPRCYVEDRVLAGLYCHIPLKGFTNLRLLELYQLYSDSETALIEDIAEVLSDCPHLKLFGIGLATDADCNRFPESYILEGECDFLERLCLSYGHRAGSQPLRLHTLRLGIGLCLYESARDAKWNFLTMLVDLPVLQSLHVFNGMIERLQQPEYGSHWQQNDWWMLDTCSSLYHLEVSRLTPGIRMWLNSKGQFIQELVVTDSYQAFQDGLEEFYFLKLPQLKMLHMTEDSALNPDEEDYELRNFQNWFKDEALDLKSNQGQIPKETDACRAISTIYEVSKLSRTVLDRLPDQGKNLVKLSISLELDTQWFQFSSHLPKLTNLRQLSLRGRRNRGGPLSLQRPVKEVSLWPGVYAAKDIAFEYAKLIKSKCSSLQYIKIEKYGWQFFEAEENGQFIMKSRLLEQDEKCHIQLFTYDSLELQAGLSMPPRGQDIIDEDEALMFEHLQKFEAAMARGRFEEYDSESEDMEETEDSEQSEESDDLQSMGNIEDEA
ncbi:hypothetical protein B0O99DRAFT_295832 [Bisporella sp. PMI_857]|nr:hypothetical protein B0O99DRAFT_295832 [Bisporella sp. PMI_857]